MKYSQKQTQEVRKANFNQLLLYNKKELNEFVKKLNITAPQALVDYVDTLPSRIARIRMMTYETFNEKFPSRIMPESFGAELDGKDTKTGFPTLYFYSPELSKTAKTLEEKNKKVGNLKRITTFLANRYGEAYENDKAIKAFVNELLPSDLPYTLVADGSRERVKRLLTKEGAILYGCEDNDIFAVEHVLADQSALTIFHSGIDFIGAFAKKLERTLEIGDKLAMTISKNLPHDAYYSIQNRVETNFEKFVIRMAKALKVEEGELVHDYAQNEDVEVVFGAHSRELALDLDDERPAAILVGSRLNLFVPGWGEHVSEE